MVPSAEQITAYFNDLQVRNNINPQKMARMHDYNRQLAMGVGNRNIPTPINNQGFLSHSLHQLHRNNSQNHPNQQNFTNQYQPFRPSVGQPGVNNHFLNQPFDATRHRNTMPADRRGTDISEGNMDSNLKITESSFQEYSNAVRRGQGGAEGGGEEIGGISHQLDFLTRQGFNNFNNTKKKNFKKKKNKSDGRKAGYTTLLEADVAYSKKFYKKKKNKQFSIFCVF